VIWDEETILGCAVYRRVYREMGQVSFLCVLFVSIHWLINVHFAAFSITDLLSILPYYIELLLRQGTSSAAAFRIYFVCSASLVPSDTITQSCLRLRPGDVRPPARVSVRVGWSWFQVFGVQCSQSFHVFYTLVFYNDQCKRSGTESWSFEVTDATSMQ